LEGQELAARHIALRERAGLTQEQEAKMAGVSPTTISGIESGKITRPHLKTLLKIARVLGVDVGELRELEKVEALPSSIQPPLNGFEEERRTPTATQIDAIEDLNRFCDLLKESVQRKQTDDMIATPNRLAMHVYMKVVALLAEDEATLPALRPAASRFRDLALEYIRLIKNPDEELEGDLIHIDEYLESRRAS
jgi:transcriptional regulator with XRE-family HTH domain